MKRENHWPEEPPSWQQEADSLFAVLERLEAAVARDKSAPAEAPLPVEIYAEIDALKAQNEALAADKQELVQAVRALKTHNDVLATRLNEVSTRLDKAIDHMTLVLQD